MDTLDIFERRGYVNSNVHVFNKHLKTYNNWSESLPQSCHILLSNTLNKKKGFIIFLKDQSKSKLVYTDIVWRYALWLLFCLSSSMDAKV